jgi:nucleoside-diphosphate-sugar epimerase
MKIFVTGGSGFIGKPVVRELAKRGHDVLVLSRKAKPDLEFTSDRIDFVRGDLKDHQVMGRIMKDYGTQALIHLAWEGLPDYSWEMCERNLGCSIKLFSEAAEAGCSRILSTGSCWEYAARTGICSEDDQLGSASVFSAVKNALRYIGEGISRDKGLRFNWLRLFFVYGPGQRKGSLIPHVIECMKTGVYPRLQNPLAGNDFVFVDDVAQAVVDVVEGVPRNVVYNVGSGTSTSVEEIVRCVYRQMDKPVDERAFVHQRDMEGQNFWANISRLGHDANWQPQHNIESGIRATLKNVGGLD